MKSLIFPECFDMGLGFEKDTKMFYHQIKN